MTCDADDVLGAEVSLPVDLVVGETLAIDQAGAYTSAYSSVGFNGFPPLDVIVL